MNTEQNYVGKGSYANIPPQTAQNRVKIPITTDYRLITPPLANVSDEVYQVQTMLLNVVDDFMEYRTPIEEINNLLEKWLTTPAVDLSDKNNARQLSLMLKLVNFLVELRESHTNLEYMAKREAQKGGVSNG
ncbi:hypothetical protein GO755_14195 [Spirosoma sp. HMF4905]|uniref:Uncharacterized protein n=1 Tax=Spirosoma arboris TaxID=2682092 RepID=A0A7K1SBL9_9BACT|nr:hypothetical protein [Spirosoma arboris]MVM31189.1 hypothetical protein [Spirosoma arboris]